MSVSPKPRILTGDTPTGKLHLGHFVGALAPAAQRVTFDFAIDWPADWTLPASFWAFARGNPKKTTNTPNAAFLDKVCLISNNLLCCATVIASWGAGHPTEAVKAENPDMKDALKATHVHPDSLIRFNTALGMITGVTEEQDKNFFWIFGGHNHFLHHFICEA